MIYYNSHINPTDIIFGTETWLTGDILNSELNLNDYDIHRRDRITKTKKKKQKGNWPWWNLYLCKKKIQKYNYPQR